MYRVRRFIGASLRAYSTRPVEDYISFINHEEACARIRSFCIIAHVDHGKSTLSDCLLEATRSISTHRKVEHQILDTLEVERERGITVKAQTASMLYTPPGSEEEYLLNLIDTPGHVDFSFEVNRSIAACDGAVLLVDSSQGVQAQTIANYRMAKQNGLKIVPVLSKSDLPASNPDLVKEELFNAFDIDPDEVLLTSAKAKSGIQQVLDALIQRVPSPEAKLNALNSAEGPRPSLRAHLVDSWFDIHRGAICLIKIYEGAVVEGQLLASYHGEKQYEVAEVGLLTPVPRPTGILKEGQVGYVVLGMRSTREVVLGDTFYSVSDMKPLKRSPQAKQTVVLPPETVKPVTTFKHTPSMLFASLYPCDGANFTQLQEAMEKLLLNDASVTATPESSSALGLGFRCGFHGALHMEVFSARLRDEFDVDVITTAPTVPYRVHFNEPAMRRLEKNELELQKLDGNVLTVENPAQFPEVSDILRVEEPMVVATILCPQSCMGDIQEICFAHRGEKTDMQFLSEQQVLMEFDMPLNEIILSFFSKIKKASSGHASFDYEEKGYAAANLAKVDVKINREPVDALAMICDRAKVQAIGRSLCSKLKELIDRQQFEIVIQVAIGSKVVASERIPPFRKDVLKGGKIGGGDETRKKKLLEKQKKGKQRMKCVGSVSLNQEVFTSVLQI